MANLQILAEREITQNSGKNEEKATTNKNDLILQKKKIWPIEVMGLTLG